MINNKTLYIHNENTKKTTTTTFICHILVIIIFNNNKKLFAMKLIKVLLECQYICLI